MQSQYSNNRQDFLIETNELAQILSSGGHSGLKIVDASWYMPSSPIQGPTEFLQKRLTKDTVFFDHDKICLPNAKFPHTLPTVEIFTQCMKALGVQRSNNIVVYDNTPFGIFSSPRAAWMLRYFGAQNVKILNGGMKKWVAEGREIFLGPQNQSDVQIDENGDYGFSVQNQDKCILDISIIHDHARQLYHSQSPQSLNFQILDARSKERFLGTAPEPRPGTRGGSIKNSINVPFTVMLNEDGTLKQNEDLISVFNQQGADINKQSICSCGSGVTACVVQLGINVLGNQDSKIYDGSWTEYGNTQEPNFDQ